MIKIINDSLLSADELDLIEKAVSFPFTAGICLDDLKGGLVIEARPEAKTIPEKAIDVKALEDYLPKARGDAQAAEDEYRKLSDELFRLYRNGDTEAADALKPAVTAAEIRMARARDYVSYLERLAGQAQGGGVYLEREILGEFVSYPAPRVYLYMGGCRTRLNRSSVVVSTFIHEMFHAVNYFRSGGVGSIREMEEPMVEYAAGVFLSRISRRFPAFDAVLELHRRYVSEKAFLVGEIACYGFGYYLMEHVATDSSHSEEEWIEAYSQKASAIDPAGAEASAIRQALYPFYPDGTERKVFSLFETVLFGKATRGARRIAPARVLKVTKADGTFLQLKHASDTLVAMIVEACPWDVHRLGISCCGEPLVDTARSLKYPDTQVEVAPGLYVQTHSNTGMKKKYLEEISFRLGLHWTVEEV